MKWQDFGKIKKDKFAAAARKRKAALRAVNGLCALDARRGVMKRCEGGLSAGAVGAPGEMVWELWGRAG